MHFSKVRLKNFRNIQDQVLSFSPRLNVLVGQNGQGKTNVLEALYLMLRGDSFRFSENANLIQNGEEQALLQGLLSQNNLEYSLTTQISKSKKNQFLQQKKVSAADVRKLFAAVLFSPESLAAIKESADHRRSLIDDLLTTYEKNNSDLILHYRKALKTRNRILRNHANGEQAENVTMDLLEALDPQFMALAAKLSVNRIQAINSLHKEINSSMQYISGEQADEISVRYLISDQIAGDFSEDDCRMMIQKRSLELRTAELQSGTSLIGPHKHDIKFLYGQNDSRFYCSQGQQRAIILSFKMAQIVYHRKAHGIYPVLMLDDVLSELDKTKRDALITFLHEIKTQIFVTTTDFELPTSFTLDQTQVFQVQNGIAAN